MKSIQFRRGLLRLCALFLLAAACALLAMPALADVTLTGNIKTVGTAAVGSKLLVRFELQNCVVSGQNIPRVIGVGILNQTYFDYPVDASGNIVAADGGTAKIYGNDQITCDTQGNSWYRVWVIYERDKQFYGEFDVTGSSFNLNSATPRTPGVSVYSPVAVLSNPAGSQTITQPAGTSLLVNTLLAADLNKVRFISQLATGGAGTVGSPWTGWEAPLNALAANLHIHCPTGFYTQATAIDMKTGWKIGGDGPTNCRITANVVGSLWKTISPINSSTAVDIEISGIGITNTHATPTGACIENVGGTFFYVHHVRTSGCKYNMILDQAEIVSIHHSIFEAPAGANSCNIWITNGADWTAGANPGFSNRISIYDMQFNNTAGVGIQICDDGGESHYIARSNLNGGISAGRFANVDGLVLEDLKSEGHSGTPFEWFATTYLNGTYVGHSKGPEVHGNVSSDAGVGGHYLLDFINGGHITGNTFKQVSAGSAAMIFKNTTSNQATGLAIGANSLLISGAFRSAAKLVDGSTGALTHNNISQEIQTYVASGHAGGAQTVTPATMGGAFTPIRVGQKLFVMNEGGTNAEDVTVTATTATTFDATFASSKSANWLIFGIYGSTYNAAVFNATTGFRQGTMTAGRVLRSDGTNFISAQLAAADLSNGVNGTGAVVLAGSPTLTTPNIGAATGTSLNLGATGVLSTTAQSGTGSICMTVSCAMTTPNIGAATATSIDSATYTLIGTADGSASVRRIDGGGTSTYWQFNSPTGGGQAFSVNGVNQLVIDASYVTLSKGRLKVAGTAPSCSFTSGGGTTPSCSLDTGSTDTAGTIIATAGTGSPGSSGTITLTFSAALGTNKPSCRFTLSNDGAGTWNARATAIDETPSMTSDLFNWDNNAVALAVSTAYHINYFCVAK